MNIMKISREIYYEDALFATPFERRNLSYSVESADENNRKSVLQQNFSL